MNRNPWRCAAMTWLALALAVPAVAGAETLRVQSAGVFAADAPTTPFSAPGAAWTLDFTLDRQPELQPDPGFLREGAYTAPLFLDFEYRLGGAVLPDASHLVLYSEAWLGGMELIFGGIPVGTPWGYNALQFYGDAYYSGSEQAPVIEAGLYPTMRPGAQGLSIAFEGLTWDQPDTLVTISAVPLPPSAAMMLGGLLALAGWRRLQGRSVSLAAAQRP